MGEKQGLIKTDTSGSPPSSFVEIDTGGITIRLPGDCTAGRIADVVLALSAGR